MTADPQPTLSSPGTASGTSLPGTSSTGTSSGQRPDLLAGHLIDMLAAMLWASPDAGTRAAAITSVVQELYDTTVWLHASDTASVELTSLARLRQAALDHQRCMGAIPDRSPGTFGAP